MPETPNPLKPLLTPPVWELLNSLPEYDDATSAQLNNALRKDGWTPETVAAVLTQSRLRRAAQRKFGDFAARMLFTAEGLQQSTRLPVAARHAQRFRRAGITTVADLGCGLGGDAMAMASAGLQVVAVEADETTAAAATINLRPFPEAQVVHGTAEDFAAEQGFNGDGSALSCDGAAGPHPGWGLWLDPARRDERSRIWDPEQFSPPLSFVTALAESGVPMGVKLGPGIPHSMIPPGCEAEWVSIDGDLVEVVLWFNALARRDEHQNLIRRTATVLHSEEPIPGETDSSGHEGTTDPLRVTVSELSSSTDFGAGAQVDPAGPAGLNGTLYEPDPAVIRAGLVAELCESLGGTMLDEHIAYFTVPTGAPVTPLARRYRVLEVMDFQVKTLKRWAQERQISSLEIKKRGVDVVPEALRKQLLPKKNKGPKRHAVVVITRLAQQRLCAVVEPLD
ncbi:class I SAM-dependent methyltransferase [Nesterenkonia massiliensis]|uniref:Class I SAM-dependent methyltransferase n=1 Tax=Nesterenkonia massiliensis TaxID=1232429 RepID=A0ABT2HT78_9MICC|nr:class I SAM-dependent methyltransferase [Nesterenkonia massiliensis]